MDTVNTWSLISTWGYENAGQITAAAHDTIKARLTNTAGKSHKCEPQDYCFGAINEPVVFWCWECQDSGLVEWFDNFDVSHYERCDCKSYPLYSYSEFSLKYSSRIGSMWYSTDVEPPF